MYQITEIGSSDLNDKQAVAVVFSVKDHLVPVRISIFMSVSYLKIVYKTHQTTSMNSGSALEKEVMQTVGYPGHSKMHYT